MKKKLRNLFIVGGLVSALFVVAACEAEEIPVQPEPPAVTTPAPATPAPTPAAVEPTGDAGFTPGTHVVTVPGWQGADMTVEVVFSADEIVSVTMLENGESWYGSGWAWRAYPATADQIVVRQSTLEIDAFTGGTSTRNSIIAAVEEAIVEAGGNPADLTPRVVTAPLPGDRFIPGYVEITVPAGTMDIYGEPLVEGALAMLYSDDVDMTLRLSFGRNKLHLHVGGAAGLGQGAYGHGETVEPGEIRGGTWGGWWFRQMAQHQINDNQSTHGIDIYTGATQSAAAIIWGVEQAMIQQGADPAAITPIALPGGTKFERNPAWDADAPFFIPGIYTVTLDGWGGPMTVRTTLDRTTIRRVEVVSNNETPMFFDMVWGSAANHVLRDAIYEANAAELDTVDAIAGATVTAEAIIEAVRRAMAMAWVD